MKDSFKGNDIIKSTFLEMYKVMPIEKIKVKELTERSGVSRSTFYFYYEDVYDLYRICQNEMLAFLESGLSDIVMSTIVRDKAKYIHYVSMDMLRYLDVLAELKTLMRGSRSVEFHARWFDSVKKAYTKAMDFSSSLSDRYKEKMICFYAAGHRQLLIDWINDSDHSEDTARLYAAVSAEAMFVGTFN